MTVWYTYIYSHLFQTLLQFYNKFTTLISICFIIELALWDTQFKLFLILLTLFFYSERFKDLWRLKKFILFYCDWKWSLRNNYYFCELHQHSHWFHFFLMHVVSGYWYASCGIFQRRFKVKFYIDQVIFFLKFLILFQQKCSLNVWLILLNFNFDSNLFRNIFPTPHNASWQKINVYYTLSL